MKVMRLKKTSQDICKQFVFETLLRTFPCLLIQTYYALYIVQTDLSVTTMLNIALTALLVVNSMFRALKLFFTEQANAGVSNDRDLDTSDEYHRYTANADRYTIQT